MKHWAVLFTTLLLLSVWAFAEDRLPEARLLNDEAHFSINDSKAPQVLFDNAVDTFYKADSLKEELTISCQTPIAAVYLRFGEVPDAYTATVGDKTISCGKQGFLHELIALEEPASSITIQLPENRLCDVSVYSSGTLPKAVEQWQPPLEQCDLLIFPTHADDDVLYMGAAVADSVDRGMRVQTAYLTHHWNDPYRPHELLAGLWEMGVTAYPVIGTQADRYAKDLEHAQTVFDQEGFLAYQVEQIRRFRPLVVLGHDWEGEYGHGMHMLGSRLLLEALEHSGNADYNPESAQKYGVWDVPKTYLHLGSNALTLNVQKPLSSFQGRTALEVAQEAFEHHKSQHGWDLAVTTYGHADCRLWSLVRSTVGQDTGKNDLFENLDVFFAPPQSQPQPAPETISPGQSSSLSSSESDAPEGAVTPVRRGPWGAALAAALFTVFGVIAVLYFVFRRRH